MRSLLWILAALLSLTNGALLLRAFSAGGAKSDPPGTGTARSRRPGSSPIDREAPVPVAATSTTFCRDAEARADRELRYLERLAASHLPLSRRLARETEANPALQVEAGTALLGESFQAGGRSLQCRGRICLVPTLDVADTNALIHHGWIRARAARSGIEQVDGRTVFSFAVADPGTDGYAFLADFWQRFVDSGAPALCLARAPSGNPMTVVLDVTAGNVDSDGPQLVASYHGPSAADALRCLAGTLDSLIRKSALPPDLEPARLSRTLRPDGAGLVR